MLHEVTITQCNIFTVYDEDEDEVEYMNSGGTLKEYVAENCIWEESLGTYYFEIDVEAAN